MFRTRSRSALVAALFTLAVFGAPNSSATQSIRTVLHKKSNLSELKAYYDERLVEIQFDVTDQASGQPLHVFGTGFIVSPDGTVVTARHVIEPLRSSHYVVQGPVKVFLHEGHRKIQMEGVGGTYRISSLADIGVFQIHSDQDFEYLCIDAQPRRIGPNDKVTMTSTRYLGFPLFATDQTFTEHVPITHPTGPGDMSQFFAVAQPIDDSMSGGAVVSEQDDKVIGVMSTVLLRDGKPVPGENYVNLLQSAPDLGLQGIPQCKPAIPGEKDLKMVSSQKEFMAHTCNGIMAWIPDGPNGEYWVFPTYGNYSLRRKDLSACPRGAPGSKLVRMVINHVATVCSGTVCALAGERTFYGVQVVPVMKEGEETSVDQQTWLYKNSALFYRRPDGSFFSPPDSNPTAPQVLGATPPSKYNQVSSQSFEAHRQCPVSASSNQCEVVFAIKSFTSNLGLQRPWHGFVSKKRDAQSTFTPSIEGAWLVRSDWLSAAKDLQVKNWILRYTRTSKTESNHPLDFSFCVDPEWSEFFLRAFSPESCDTSEPLHVFLLD
jgi:hypothetical protein